MGKKKQKRCLFCCLLCPLDSTEALIDPDPSPGVVTMRRTLKRDLPRLLLTQHKRESRIIKRGEERNEINGLCVAWKQWRPFSTEAPVPSVPALQHSQSQQAALCGRCWTRVTPSMCPAALDDADRQETTPPPYRRQLPSKLLLSKLGTGQFFTNATTTRLWQWHGLCCRQCKVSNSTFNLCCIIWQHDVPTRGKSYTVNL